MQNPLARVSKRLRTTQNLRTEVRRLRLHAFITSDLPQKGIRSRTYTEKYGLNRPGLTKWALVANRQARPVLNRQEDIEMKLIPSLVAALGVALLVPFSALAAQPFPDPAVDASLSAGKGSETAVLAGGCFWGVEAVFDHLKGVKSVVAGFS